MSKSHLKQSKYTNIYFPMTCSILTPGHIRCLGYLTSIGFVTIGLLTSKAMKGYKKEIVPYKDRKYVLDTVALALEDIDVVPQDDLDPRTNLLLYDCTHLASGDGFEKDEIEAAKWCGVDLINIKLRGEKKKKWSSSRVLDKANMV